VHYFTNAHGRPTLFILNPHSGIPLYRQLQEQIRRLAASGQLEPGTPLPSIRELAVRHAINPMTVSKVYSQLESEGVLERHRGKQMTIAAKGARAAARADPAEQLQPHLDGLVLAGRQLDLSLGEVVRTLKERWEK